jgi:hypothetical protein
MSDEEKGVNASKAIELAMDQVRAKGLSEEHMSALFQGSQDISAREALMIAHIQHLEAKVFALASIMEEIAVMKGGAGVVAQSALENLVSIPRKTNGDN